MPDGHPVQAFTEPFADIVRRLAPRAAASLRIGETAAVDLGGVAGVTDGFGHGFWATYQYGWLARAGFSVVHRQVLACTAVPQHGAGTMGGCSYGVLGNSPGFEPLPDYWWSVLHKRLMGTAVLATNVTSRGSDDRGAMEGGAPRLRGVVRVYAHCAAPAPPAADGSSDGGDGAGGGGGVALMWAHP